MKAPPCDLRFSNGLNHSRFSFKKNTPSDVSLEQIFRVQRIGAAPRDQIRGPHPPTNDGQVIPGCIPPQGDLPGFILPVSMLDGVGYRLRQGQHERFNGDPRRGRRRAAISSTIPSSLSSLTEITAKNPCFLFRHVLIFTP